MKQVIVFIENEYRRQAGEGIVTLLGDSLFLDEYLCDFEEGGIPIMKWKSKNYKCILIKQDADPVIHRDSFPDDIFGYNVVLIDDTTAVGVRDWGSPDDIGVIYHSWPKDFPEDFPYKIKKEGQHDPSDSVYKHLSELLATYKEGVSIGFNKEKYDIALNSMIECVFDTSKEDGYYKFVALCLTRTPEENDWKILEAAGINTNEFQKLITADFETPEYDQQCSALNDSLAAVVFGN